MYLIFILKIFDTIGISYYLISYYNYIGKATTGRI